MRLEWFKETVQKLTPAVEWRQGELNDLARHFKAICQLYKGCVFRDEDVPEALEREYCNERVERILNCLARSYARWLSTTADPPLYPADSDSFQVKLTFLSAKKLVPKINLNVASEDELESLPGIGRTTAKRIIQLRQAMRGKFSDIDDLKQVKGIGKRQIDLFRKAVYLDSAPHVPVFHSASIEKFRRSPTFKNYVEVIEETDSSLSSFAPIAGETLKDRIVREVVGVRKQLEKRGYNHYTELPGITGSRLNEMQRRRVLAEEVGEKVVRRDMHGSLVEDAQYPVFVRKLLAESRESVRLIMFFMRFEEDVYATDALFDELVAAKNRGVNVKVILDHDAEGDAINSRVINEEAYAFLQKNKIPVVYDSVEKYTHTKLVLVDRAHVLLGSHNWTAGSFFHFDDTSVYICSSDLAEHYYKQFESLWGEYAVQ